MASVTDHDRGWDSRIAQGEHAERCDGSCYDCLRDYSNADLHAVLDWRLALDVSDLAVSAKADLSTASPRWASLARRAGESLREVAPGRSVQLDHPLRESIETGPALCNVFDAIRRPGLVAARCQNL
jgi:hypothetical protein